MQRRKHYGRIYEIHPQNQEYNGHSELVCAQDSKLSGKWHSLFYVQLVVGIIVGIISTSAVVIAALVGVDAPIIVTVFLWCSTVLSTLIQLVYLLYLKKTAALFADR